MIGHRAIVDARRRRLAPVVVFVDIAMATEFERRWMEREFDEGGPPTVITDGDDPGLADLRFLHGLDVVLAERPTSPGGFLGWFDAIVDVKPRSLVAMGLDGEMITWPR